MRFVLTLFTAMLLLTETVFAMDALFGKSSPRQVEMLYRMNEKNRQKVDNINQPPCYGGLNKGDCFEETQLYQAFYNLIDSDVPALGFVLTAFFPPTSPEYQKLVESFEEVNKKLDDIGDKVDDILRILPLTTQKTAYISVVSDINASHEKLMDFYNELSSTECKPNITCLQVRSNIASKFIKYFNVHKQLHQLVKGAVEGFGNIGEPLMVLMQDATKCNRDQVQALANTIASAIYKGTKVEIAREILEGLF